jgi:hypothetical protein
MGYITATGTLAWAPTAIPTFVSSPEDKDLYDLLMDGIEETIVVYDNGQKVGWCLPQASVVLSLAHRIISRRGYRIFHNDNEASLKFARPGPDGALEATKTMMACFELKIRKYYTATEYEEGAISGLLKKIWQKLTDIGSGLLSADHEFQRVKEVPPSYVHGVEFCV